MVTDPRAEAAGDCLGAAEAPDGVTSYEALTPEPGSCVLVGPRGAGKSGFLAALGRAFEAERSPGWEWFVPGRALAALSADSPPVSAARTYSFQLGIRSEQPLEITVLDTPDSFFEDLSGTETSNLPPATIEDLVHASRNARCLMLCVPAENESIEPVDLTRFVNRLLVAGSRRLLRLGGRRWPGLESPWERPPQLELPFDRVLILLTGIEGICDDILRRLEDHEHNWRLAPPDLHTALAARRDRGPLGVADLIDGWALADERILGLDILSSSLRPDATMAVCPIGLRGLQRGRSASRPLSFFDWTDEGADRDEAGAQQPTVPFGIWPALRFLATGRAEGPVAIGDRSRKYAAHARCSVLGDEREEE